jgi:hypothetical protein
MRFYNKTYSESRGKKVKSKRKEQRKRLQKKRLQFLLDSTFYSKLKEDKREWKISTKRIRQARYSVTKQEAKIQIKELSIYSILF